jgi:nucleotide-binding universal stress UspA family protein
MKKLLVAFDDSPGAEIAVQDLLCAGLPRRVEAKVLTIADVFLPPAAADPGDASAAIRSRSAAYEKGMELLREAKKTSIHGAQLLHQFFPEWNITNSASPESPAWGIVADAQKWGADLIVIGSHGRTPIEKFFLGSVSYTVAAEAACSVRVVRPRPNLAWPPIHIMIGLDASDESMLGVDEVAERQWPPGTEVELVAVIDPKLRTHILSRRDAFGDPAAFEKFEDVIELSLQNARKKLNHQELTIHSHIFEGDPKHVLLHQAADRKIDCIFIGAHGREHGARVRLGTVASAVCTRAHCTVEIVRKNFEPGRQSL